MGLQMEWQRRAAEKQRVGPPLGLKNLGNTCYLNSVLQCLTYTPPFAQFCLSSQHSSLCKVLLANKEKECPFCILERQIVRSLSLDGPADSPSMLHKCLTLFAEHFRWGRQEDAHEFLRYIIDACHNTCLKLLKRLAATGNGSGINGNGGLLKGATKKEAAETSTVMKQIFGGALLSQVKCLSCKGESNKIDEIMDICLDLYESNSLKDAFSRFFQSEILEGSNKYSCERCKKLSVAKKQLFMRRAPNVLVIQLKRFEGINGGKINRNIEFEEKLELSNYLYNSAQDSQPKYNLFGSIVHSGYSPESGHYYSYIKDSFGRWYCCNDAHVSLSSTKEVLSEKVYILFYLRVDQHQMSGKAGSPINGLKHADYNINSTSKCHINAQISKPVGTKDDCSISSSNKVLPLKNGKIFSNPQIKPIALKSSGTSKLFSYGNDVHNISNGRHGDAKQSHNEVINNVSNGRNSVAKQSSATEKSILSSEGNSMEQSMSKDNVDPSSLDNTSSVTTTFTSITSKQHVNVVCGSTLNGAFEDIAASDLLTGSADPSLVGPSDDMVNEQKIFTSIPKRKSCGAEKADDMVSFAGKSSVLLRNDMKHSSEEIDKFKEFLASEAFLGLQASDWIDKVHDFMRARKRSHTQGESQCQNNTKLKEELINGARENFISQIPGSLKGRLIELLKLFCQKNSLLDI